MLHVTNRARIAFCTRRAQRDQLHRRVTDPQPFATPIPAIGRLGTVAHHRRDLARRRPASLTITHIGRLCAYQPSGAGCQLPAHIEPIVCARWSLLLMITERAQSLVTRPRRSRSPCE